jgi:DNA-binding transcriptional MerR regulator
VANLLNIAALARRTGVAPDRLRKWEQRYHLLHPSRTPGGQRRYAEPDVARVEWLRDRLREGWRIGEAARVLRASAAPALADPAALRNALLETTRSGDPESLEPLLDQAFAVLPLEGPSARWSRPCSAASATSGTPAASRSRRSMP